MKIAATDEKKAKYAIRRIEEITAEIEVSAASTMVRPVSLTLARLLPSAAVKKVCLHISNRDKRRESDRLSADGSGSPVSVLWLTGQAVYV